MASSSSAQTASAQAAPTTSQVSSTAADSPYPATAAAQTATASSYPAATAAKPTTAAGNASSTHTTSSQAYGSSSALRLRNADIVRWNSAGVSPATIISHIQSAESVQFDLSSAGLTSLRASGVSEPVIAAMKKRAGVSN
jgi:hypothetical protein